MCLICERISEIEEGKNPYFVKEMETGYVVIGDHQAFEGYTLFLCKQHVTDLDQLERRERNLFLEEMADVAEAVKEAFNSLTKAFDRLFRRVKVKKNLIGFLRSVEVTHNEKENTYHPHIHVLMMVKSSYFAGKQNYISQEEWGQMWSQSLKVDYVPMVDVRAVKERGKGLKGAILETAKYPTKPIELDLKNAQVVDDLYNGLYRKRQLGYGGLFKTIKKKLELDDVENGDLVHTTDDNEVSEGTKIVAIWNATKQNYFLK